MKKIEFIEEPDSFAKDDMHLITGGNCNTFCIVLAGDAEKMQDSIVKRQSGKNATSSINKDCESDSSFTWSNLLFIGKGGFCFVFQHDE